MKLYDSLNQKKINFKPLSNKTVKMYVCGITPYDTTHLGHAFVYVFFDTLKKYLEFKKYKVIYTQNVTDIDDDILKKAKEVGRDWKELGEFWTDRFLTDLKFLNVKMPDHYVKATDAISTILEITEGLTNKGFAYEKEGNVYFEIAKYPNYGQLSKFSKEEMLKLLKERGGDPGDPLKKDPLDFLLWQRSKEGEPSWPSPFGKGRPAQGRGSPGGRPGWHIECSAMVKDTLGDQIDIHGGGGDLKYPHHESELAQTESFTGKTPFVKYWMHIGMLRYEGEKMSKSLGNLVLVSNLKEKYSANAIRFLLLSHHYRKEWEFEYGELDEAEKKVKTLQEILDRNIKDQSFDENIIYEAIEDDADFAKGLDLIWENAEKMNNAQLARLVDLLGFKFYSFVPALRLL